MDIDSSFPPLHIASPLPPVPNECPTISILALKHLSRQDPSTGNLPSDHSDEEVEQLHRRRTGTRRDQRVETKQSTRIRSEQVVHLHDDEEGIRQSTLLSLSHLQDDQSGGHLSDLCQCWPSSSPDLLCQAWFVLLRLGGERGWLVPSTDQTKSHGHTDADANAEEKPRTVGEAPRVDEEEEKIDPSTTAKAFPKALGISFSICRRLFTRMINRCRTGRIDFI